MWMGTIHIVWTENQKFRVSTNIYLQSARNLMEREQPKAILGYLDLNGKCRGQYSVWLWHQGEPLSYIMLVELN